MNTSAIICLPDLLRGTRAFSEGFFDLIREPIRQACQIDMAQVPSGTVPHSLLPTFDLAAFRQLAGADGTASGSAWQSAYFHLPEIALAYLQQHIPQGCLAICFEIPPWLESALNQWAIPFIDIRVSPLRFGRDLYIAMKSNDATLQARISAHQVLDEELRLEASYLAANVSMHRQRLVEGNRPMPSLENALVFIGQAPFDASLIRSDGHAISFKDYREQIRALSQGRELLHKPHPFALDFAEEERKSLADITGQKIHHCALNAYQILSSKEDVELIGLSSGLLQEALWFNKKSHVLHQPFTPVSSAENDLVSYKQVHFQRWLSPGFWHALLTPEKPAPKLTEITPLAHHHARHTIDQWWDYLKVLTWEKAHSYESFERAGGGALRNRILALEQSFEAPPPYPDTNDQEEQDAEWHAFKQHILNEFSSQPQQFGRGLLYQGHEAWKLPGQRPTQHRLEKYGLNNWLSSQDSLLDIGCNIGMFGMELSPHIASYEGFDSNPALIEIARKIAVHKNIHNCSFKAQDFDEFIKENTGRKFDKILSFAVHVWINQPLEQYAQLLWNLLKPNGILVIESNNLATNDKLFFPNMKIFIDQGFELLNQGMLKDDGIIERGFFLFRKPALCNDS